MSDANANAYPEWGKMSRGQPYVNLATDIFRALFALGLGEIEGSVLAHVIENTWGKTSRRGRKGTPWPESEPCAIDQSALSSSLKIDKGNLSRAIDRLVKSNLLFATGPRHARRYAFNKNAHEWVNPRSGEALLRPPAIDHALQAQRFRVVLQDNSNPTHPVVFEDNSDPVSVVFEDNSKAKRVVFKDNSKRGPVVFEDNSAHCIEERGGNPTGSIQITCPNGQGAAAQPVVSISAPSAGKKRRKKERVLGLNLTDAPIEILPLVVQPGEKRLHDHVLSLTRSKDHPDGDPVLADHVVREFRDWLRQGFSLAIVREAVNDTINKVGARNVKRFSTYLAAILKSEAAKATEKPVAPPISQRLAEPIPNVSLGLQASKVITAQDEAYRTSEGLWENLAQPERSAIEAEFDAANPRPSGLPVAMWRVTRKRGCIDLMASRNANPNRPS